MREVRYPQKINKRYIGVTVIDRVFAHVSEVLDNNCWLFEGSKDKAGYGKIRRFRGSMCLAHRVMYEELIGEIPEALVLDHLCRTRNCVNPDHLEPVTQQENIKRGLGQGPALAALRNKTQCINGHSYTKENTYHHPKTNARNCKKCQYIRNLKSVQRRVSYAN